MFPDGNGVNESKSINYSVEPDIWLIGNRRNVVLDPSMQTAVHPPPPPPPPPPPEKMVHHIAHKR